MQKQNLQRYQPGTIYQTNMFRFVLLFIVLLQGSAFARKLEVGEKQKFKRIKSALSVARDYDTIIVHAGIYTEGNLTITKPLVLIGVDLPIIDGQKKFEIISIRAHFVTIKGFQLQHSGFATLNDPGAIKVYDHNFITLIDNVLDDNFFGIYIQYGKYCTIKNNKIRAYSKQEQQIGNGIHCWKSEKLTIIGNTVQGHRDGIYFEFVTHSVIKQNVSKFNIRYGLHFMFSNNDDYLENTFHNNGAGVAVMFTNHVKMINNVFEENWGDAAYGLMLKEISDAEIRGNRFSKNTTGIYMEGTNRVTVLFNQLFSNGWGMKIQASCMDNTITQNNFINNTFDISTNGDLVLNTFDLNYWDKYEGYDIDRNGIGDVPYHPLSLFSVIVEKNNSAMLLFRSTMTSLLDKSEKMIPSLTPSNFVDNNPRMQSFSND